MLYSACIRYYKWHFPVKVSEEIRLPKSVTLSLGLRANVLLNKRRAYDMTDSLYEERKTQLRAVVACLMARSDKIKRSVDPVSSRLNNVGRDEEKSVACVR